MDLPDTLNVVVKLTENFLETLEEKVSAQNMKFWKMKSKVRLEYFDKTSYFELKIFLQVPLENFLWALRQRSMQLGDPFSLSLSIGKTIVTLRHTNPIICQEKWKKLRFWKMKPKVGLEYSDKTSYFELRLFFKRF